MFWYCNHRWLIHFNLYLPLHLIYATPIPLYSYIKLCFIIIPVNLIINFRHTHTTFTYRFTNLEFYNSQGKYQFIYTIMLCWPTTKLNLDNIQWSYLIKNYNICRSKEIVTRRTINLIYTRQFISVKYNNCRNKYKYVLHTSQNQVILHTYMH